MVKKKLTEKALKEQIAKAKERTRLADAAEPTAKAVNYDPKTSRITVELSNGSDFRFSPSSVQELLAASPDEIAQVEISPSGRTLRWKGLDADLSLPGLMMGIFGTKMWMAQLGQMGGQTTSRAKATAARLNGMKGGRPARRATHVAARAWATTRTDRTVRSVAGSALTQRSTTTKSSRVAGKYAKKK